MLLQHISTSLSGLHGIIIQKKKKHKISLACCQIWNGSTPDVWATMLQSAKCGASGRQRSVFSVPWRTRIRHLRSIWSVFEMDFGSRLGYLSITVRGFFFLNRGSHSTATVVPRNILLHKIFSVSTSTRPYDHTVYDFSSCHCREYNIILVYYIWNGSTVLLVGTERTFCVDEFTRYHCGIGMATSVQKETNDYNRERAWTGSKVRLKHNHPV